MIQAVAVSLPVQMVQYRRVDGGIGEVREEEFERLLAATRQCESSGERAMVDVDGMALDTYIAPGVIDRPRHFAVYFDDRAGDGWTRVDVAVRSTGLRAEHSPRGDAAIAALSDLGTRASDM